MAYYASRLGVVEVNASFYRRIDPSIYAQWAEQTPDGFKFLVKAHRAVANRPRDHRLAAEYIRNQWNAVEPLREAGKFGGFLVQFGANVRPRPEMYDYLSRLRDGLGEDPVAIEFRHPAWLDGETRVDTLERLRALGLAAVIPDEPRAAAAGLPEPVQELTASSLAYYRFMGRDSCWRGLSSRTSGPACGARIHGRGDSGTGESGNGAAWARDRQLCDLLQQEGAESRGSGDPAVEGA